MAHTDTLIAIRANLEAELTAETALRAAGGRGRPTYTANGRTVSWDEWVQVMTKSVADLTALINSEQTAQDPYELHQRGWV